MDLHSLNLEVYSRDLLRRARGGMNVRVGANGQMIFTKALIPAFNGAPRCRLHAARDSTDVVVAIEPTDAGDVPIRKNAGAMPVINACAFFTWCGFGVKPTGRYPVEIDLATGWIVFSIPRRATRRSEEDDVVETTERTYSHDGGTVWFRRHRPNDAVVAMCSDEEYAEIIVAALSAYIGEGPDAVPEMADLRAEIDRLTAENAELCAAAPDLLDACRAALGELGDSGLSGDKAAADACRAAIAKATASRDAT